jgi:hypothetical protein
MMAVERLGQGGLRLSGRSTAGGTALRDVDRFLTLARLAQGAIAIHGAAGTALGSGGELLATALLITRLRRRRRPRRAWLRITQPGPALGGCPRAPRARPGGGVNLKGGDVGACRDSRGRGAGTIGPRWWPARPL